VLDQPDPIELELNKFPDILGQLVEHRDTWIMRYRADLSTDPRPAHH
jgi:hypothetical protein